jgi:hypothetical protein
MSDVSIFSLAGVMKNDVLDCWEFTNEEDIVNHDTNKVIESEELPEIMDESPKANHKRKKRAKKNARNKEIECKADRKVRWGHVQEFLFSRGLSWTSIPSNGSYPLGLEEYQGEHSYSLDLPYCAPTSQPKDSMIQTRGGKKKRSISNVNNTINDSSFSQSSEPSQFGSLNEKDRLAILKGESVPSSHHNSKDVTSDKNYLNEVNREIKKIRESRAHIGCDCKPIKVEKLNVTKLKAEITQRKSILRKIASSSGAQAGDVDNLNLDKMKKVELMKTLKEILKECKLCVSNNCECFRAGIPCSTLACGCIRNTSAAGSNLSEIPGDSTFAPAESDTVSDQTTVETGESSPTSVTHDDHPRHDSLGEKESENCENPFGKDLFDFDSVDCYRKAIIEKFHSTVSASQVSSY